MQLSKYISDLLYRYECVMIPNFGGFVSNTISSTLDTHHQFTPPTKNISFNVNLQQNDGLLINHIAKSLHISFDEAAKQVQETVQQWKEHLQNTTLVLNNIGTFALENEQILFEPSHTVNYLASSFGLQNVHADFVLRNNIVTPEEVVSKQKKSYKKYIVAAAVVGGLFISSNLYINHLTNQQEIAAQEKITQQIEQASFNILTPLPTLTLTIEKEEVEKEVNVETVALEDATSEIRSQKYHIIAGAFKDVNNAIKKVTFLNQKGYNAQIIGVNKWGLTQVSYAAFDNKRNAINQLNSIRKKDNKHAWLYINN